MQRDQPKKKDIKRMFTKRNHPKSERRLSDIVIEKPDHSEEVEAKIVHV